MYPPINPISTRLETSKYPLDSSVQPGKRYWNPTTVVIDVPTESSSESEESQEETTE